MPATSNRESAVQPDNPQEHIRAKAFESTPKLSHRNLTLMLAAMCIVPIATILLLWLKMPPVYESKLKASAELVGHPPPNYYELNLADRVYLPEVALAVTNESDESWTNVNIRINGYYDVHEHDHEFRPGETREYLLNRFIIKSGDFYDMRYRPVHSVMVYARQKDMSRATFYKEFSSESVGREVSEPRNSKSTEQGRPQEKQD